MKVKNERVNTKPDKTAKKGYFEKYYARLMWEGIIKSLLIGFIIGFCVNFIAAAVFWINDIKNFWLSIVIGLLVGGGISFALYNKVFIPTTQKIAMRVDRLGLEERLITMTELENDESYIALRQREDAKEKMKTISAESIRYKFSTLAIVFCSIAFAFSTTMTTVAGLSEAGIIDKGSNIIEEIVPGLKELVEVSYDVDPQTGGGLIEGETAQIIEKGYDCTTVIAIPDDGYIFQQWSDGYPNPVRTDLAVEESFSVFAVFQMLQEGSSDDQWPGKPEGGEGEPNPDAPPKRENIAAPDTEPNENPNPSAVGKYEESNLIINGQIYYREEFDKYYQKAMEALAANQELPPELRELIETYMGSLK